MASSFSFTGGALPAGATLTRASTGYAVAVGGNLTSYANNVARFDYDPISHTSNGLMIEAASTNYMLQSQTIDQVPWGAGGGGTNPAAGANVATAPDGTNTADSIIAGTTNGNQHRTQNVTLPAAGTYTESGYFKANTYTKCGMTTVATGTFPGAYFDLTTGTLSLGNAAISATMIKQMANGWYWISITYQIDAGHLTGQHSAFFTNGGNSFSFAGDGVKNGYFWGGQVEAGGVATSYIPTVGASATRAADVLVLNWFSQFGTADGQYYVRYTFDDNSIQDVLTTISAGTSTVPTNLNRSRIKTATLFDAITPPWRRVTLTEPGPKSVGL